jgi:hypothetical protein
MYAKAKPVEIDIIPEPETVVLNSTSCKNTAISPKCFAIYRAAFSAGIKIEPC